MNQKQIMQEQKDKKKANNQQLDSDEESIISQVLKHLKMMPTDNSQNQKPAAPEKK